jgi:spore germination protein YaaH
MKFIREKIIRVNAKKPLNKLDYGLIFIAGFLFSISIIYFDAIRSSSEKKDSVSNIKLQEFEVVATPAERYVSNYERIGFLPSWTLAKNIDIPTSKLSQIIYFGLGVTDNGELIKFKEDGYPVLEWSYFMSDEFEDVKKQARTTNTKVLIAIKNFDNQSIDNLISNKTYTKNFINQLLKIIEDNDLDGVNIDFEYVSRTDFPTGKFFNRFLEMVVTDLKKTDPNLIISLDVNAWGLTKDPAYDMVKKGQLVDQVILMGYDFNRAGSQIAGPVAPLYEQDGEESISAAIKALIGRVPQEKIILGLPFYGYEWQTYNESYKSRTVPNTGALATYGRVQDLLNNRNDIQVSWEDETKSPWLIYKQSGLIKQIYYEDARSIAAKLEFVKEKNLSGIAIWAVGYEGGYAEPWEVIDKYLR